MTLARLLARCPDALEADFQRFYQLDIAELYGGCMPVRRAANLAGNLPPGAACWAALGVDAAWEQHSHILADLYDAIAQIAGAKGVKYPRPADARKRREREDRAAQRALRRMKRRKRPRLNP